MQRRTMSMWIAACVAACVGGCGPRSVVKDPSAITLKDALTEVGEGLAAMVKAQPESSDFGVYPAEVTVSFNVEASGNSSAALMVTPGLPDVTPATERTGMKASVGESATRANTVTVKFINVLFAPPDALVQRVTGAQLFELRQAMLGIDPRTVMVPVQATTVPAPVSANAPSVPAVTASSAVPAGAPGGVQAPQSPRATLPAMKFLSPGERADNPVEVIRALPPERLELLARSINAKVGMEIVSPALAPVELRERLIEASKRLELKTADIEAMLELKK